MHCRPTHFDLQGLPIELQLRIIEREVDPEDLENLILCSKSIFDLSKQARINHIERKRKYSLLTVGNVPPRNGNFEGSDLPTLGAHAFFTLRQVLENNFMVDYCKILKLMGLNSEVDPCEDFAELETLVEKGPYRGLIDWSRYIEGDHDSACSALFILARNIEILENGADIVDGFELHFQPIGNTHRHLREVRLYGDEFTGEKISKVYLFASIPSVRKIHGRNIAGDSVYGGGSSLGTNSVGCPGIGALEEIYFERSAIDGPTFEKFLSAINALRIFYYVHTTSLEDHDAFEPRRLIDDLRHYASHSLECLTVVDDRGREAADSDVNPRTHRSLQEFRVLKHAAIESSLFVDGYEGVVSRLVDVLPPTLETLVLHAPAVIGGLKAMFADLVQLKEERLPNLGSIVIKGEELLPKDIEGECRQVGINFEVSDWWDTGDCGSSDSQEPSY
ncbi:MAG: hypothetical protein Q9178_006616 [Gyalolechia marmorata]